jgi:hypothetical protein
MQLLRVLTAAAVFVLAAGAAEARGHHSSSDYYTNSSGHEVHRPVHASRAPSGWSAQCRDGTYSFSEHHRGTCSHHGGVARWR